MACECCKLWMKTIRDLDASVVRIKRAGVFIKDYDKFLDTYRNALKAVENEFIKSMGQSNCVSVKRKK